MINQIYSITALLLVSFFILGNGVYLNNHTIFADKNKADENSSCFEEFLVGPDISALVHDFGGESLNDISKDLVEFGISQSELEHYLDGALELSKQTIGNLIECEKDIGVNFDP